MQSLREGSLLQGGKYKIERVLGQGGFGITYLATQNILERKVAIKEFFMKELCNRDASTSHVSLPSVGSRELVGRFRQKFLKEASIIARFDNPHIVHIYDIFEENGTAYYVMEFLENRWSRFGKDGLPWEASLNIIRQVGDGLNHLHAQNVLHLDVKPSNILFRKDCPVLIDFGISKHYDAQGEQTSKTPVGVSKGYAPLEQYNQGVHKFQPATDVYSLGATLYKLITGETPPEASDVMNYGLPTTSLQARNVPRHIIAAIQKSMEPRVGQRYQSVGEFLARLGSPETGEIWKDEVNDEDTEFVVDSDSDVKPKPRIKPKPAPKPEPKPEPKTRSRWPYVAAVAGFLACMLLWKMCAGDSDKDDVIATSDTLPAAIQQLERDMVFVEGGTFTMGATPEQGSETWDNEKPAHEVTLSSFHICRHEVTQAEWEAVMGSNPSYFKGSNRPVEQVSWDDCQTFIRKLNAQTGKQFRLPTEAEWEYAARGGRQNQGYKYSGSNTLGSVAWYDKNSYDKGENSPDYGTHDVMTKAANELGLYDMSGNVYEWCSDWYGDYSSSAQTPPKGPSSGSDRVNRGGGWFINAWFCRVSSRGGDTPGYRDFSLGLRLAL